MKTMRLFPFMAFALFLCTSALQAQDGKKADRPSPPKQAMASVNGSDITIDYSSPAVKGREIWGDLVPYGKVWRTGANEATTFTTEKAVTIAGNKVPAGKYALFTIPGEDEWVVILNSVWDQWGAYNYDETEDLIRFTVKPEKMKETQERLEFSISDKGQVAMKWANAKISFTVK